MLNVHVFLMHKNYPDMNDSAKELAGSLWLWKFFYCFSSFELFKI